MLEKFFTPQTLAIVGVSLEKEKLGNKILKNVLETKFGGKVYPVNQKATSSTYLNGLRVYPNVKEIPGEVDLCVIVVPPRFVLPVIEDCGEKEIKAAVIITAGFKETGKQGALLENELVNKARKLGVRILGPNVLGIINTHHNLNASFAPAYPPAGNIAFLSQSGALGCVVLDRCREEGVGLSKFISLGNKADLDEVDFLRILKEDAQTKVILGYLEGIQRGREFLEVAEEVSKEKPVVMIKSGRSRAGKKAVSSHTGALSGADEAYEVAFKEAGIIRARTITEAFELVRGFSSQSIPRGNRVLLLTNAGGAGIMATDACEDHSLPLACLTENSLNELKKKMPGASSFSNPLDILGDADPERFRIALNIVLKDPNVDILVILVSPQAVTKPREIAEVVQKLARNADKPVLCSFMGGETINSAVQLLYTANIPNYKDPESAIRVLRSMIDYQMSKQKKVQKIKNFPVEKSRVKAILEEDKNKGYSLIGGARALEIMKAYGIPTVENYLAGNAEEALSIVEKIGEPVVMKIESPLITHKSDIGGVKVGVEKAKVKEVFQQIIQNARNALEGKNEIKGVSIQPVVREGKEVLIGVIRDEVFGHLIRFGLGGKYVELFRDFSTRLVPLTPSKAEEMIEETKIASKLLTGFRDEPIYDVKLVKESLLRLSQLVQDFPWIEEIEANPLTVWEEGGAVIDARVRIVKED